MADEIDYQRLLAKYICHVIEREGVHFIGQWSRTSGLFTDAEWAELQRIVDETDWDEIRRDMP